MIFPDSERPLPRWPAPSRSGSCSRDEVPPLPPFQLADGSGEAVAQTRVRLCWDDLALQVRFDCMDFDAWGPSRQRNAPIYQGGAVEVFLAPGEAAPVRYLEFEVSPLGTLFDATIHNPTS